MDKTERYKAIGDMAEMGGLLFEDDAMIAGMFVTAAQLLQADDPESIRTVAEYKKAGAAFLSKQKKLKS